MTCSAWWFSEKPKPKENKPPVLAICVGHSRYHDMGAVACDGETTEWHYNLQVAKAMSEHLEYLGVPNVIIAEYLGAGYTAAMEDLASKLKDLKVSAAVELHFNSAGPDAHGSEMLYWHTSNKSKELAEFLQEAVIREFGTRDRGARPRDLESRGSLFLRATHCPAVICEPFFGSNEQEWDDFKNDFDSLGMALAEGFNNYYETKRS